MRPRPGSSPESGQTLMGVLVTAFIGSIVMFAMISMTRNATVAERGVASNLDLTEIINNIRLLTDSSATCPQSGMFGVNITGLLSSPPTPVPLTLNLPGSTTPLYFEGQTISTRQITQLRLTQATLVSGNTYLVTLHLSTVISGKALTSRAPDKDFYLNVTVDGSNKIQTCGTGGGCVYVDSHTNPATPSQTGFDPAAGYFGLAQCPANYYAVSGSCYCENWNSGTSNWALPYSCPAVSNGVNGLGGSGDSISGSINYSGFAGGVPPTQWACDCWAIDLQNVQHSGDICALASAVCCPSYP